jgi:hypothetical protein
MTVTSWENGQPITRIKPELPVQAMKTYQMTSARRPASCEEAGCAHYTQGWKTIVPVDSPQAHYIRHDRSRRHIEERSGDGLVTFTFEPGQKCFAFADHTLPAEGRERFIERGGDWRGNPRREFREHVDADDFVDSFANHQDKLATRLAQG